jgi:hypothetical protein
LFCIYYTTKNTHWAFNIIIKNSYNQSFFIDYFLIKNITNQLNIINYFLNKKLKIFYFNENFFFNEITKFNKFILNLFDLNKYNFLLFSMLKLFRKNIFKLKIRSFLKKKRIKIICILDPKFFNLIDFFKNLKLFIIGLVPINYNFGKFDFFIPVTKYLDLIKYFFFFLFFFFYI